MSTPTITVTAAHASAADRIRPQRFSTLVRVELRKMVDTRSGKVLLAGIVGLAAVVLGWKVAHSAGAPVTFHAFNMGTSVAVAFVLPIIGLLAMTAEWTQRTALTTFTMSPRRLRVAAAKIAAALALSLGVLAVTFLMTLAATALGGVVAGHAASYHGIVGDVRGTVIATLAQVVMGAALGALLPVTAVAIGVFLAVPTVWSAVAPNLLGRASVWFDVFGTYERIGSAHPGAQLGHSVTSVAVWVVLPMAAGLARSARREVT